jgi:hypothetical protein
MPRVSAFPYANMDSELKAIVQASDEALQGSEKLLINSSRQPIQQ